MSETAAQLYERLVTDREPYLTRAREASKLTLPHLIPEEGHNGHSKLKTPFQGVGARGVNNLSAKLLMALLPPNTPFFKLYLDDYSLEELTGDEDSRSEVEESLNKIERAVQGEIEGEMVRVTVSQALKYLVVSGNALLYLPNEGGMRTYRIDQYVVRRDPFGNILEKITQESVDRRVLEPDLLEMLPDQDPNNTTPVDVYTHVQRLGGKWQSYQEIEGNVVPGSEGTYPLGKCPWIALRFTKIDGENYGRGYIEDSLGDLKSLEALTKAITEGSAAAARVLFFLNPNGTTRARAITESENLAVVSGNAQDITVLGLEKFADFRVALETARAIEQRLQQSFLLNGSVQRKAERVTAEEIRFMAGELEDGLGGVYSILSQELQLPLVKTLMYRMEKAGRLPVLPQDVVSPRITAGLEALGRGHDLNKLSMFTQAIAPMGQLTDPGAIGKRVDIGNYIKRVGTSLGIDMSDLVRSEEQIQEMEKAQQMEAMMAQMAPSMIPGSEGQGQGQ